MLALLGLVWACGPEEGNAPRVGDDIAPASQVSVGHDGLAGTARDRTTLTLALQLARGDRALREQLAPSSTPWQSAGAGLGSVGWRASDAVWRHPVGVRLPPRADQPLEIGLGALPELTLTLTPEGARAAPLVEDAGRMFYADAHPSTDLVFVASPRRVEWLWLLRDERAPTSFSWQVQLPSGLPRIRREPSGALVAVDAADRPRLRVSVPYALDARGTRREAALAWVSGRIEVRLDAAQLEYPILLDPALEAAVWVERSPVNSPSARWGPAMAYDSQRQRVVLFGGHDGSDYQNDTWEWDGSDWALRTPATSPGKRAQHAMAFDSAHGVIVLFGGVASGYLGDTWEWDGTNWALRSPAASPTQRSSHAMAYDAKLGRVVLFGGLDGSYLGDTWEWDNTNWARTSTGGPTRASHAMAFDGARFQTMAFGGGSPSLQADTLRYVGNSWTPLAPAASPTARFGHRLVNDAARGKLVLFGGQSTTYLGDTWEWDGTDWAQTTASGPTPRNYAAMAYDGAHGKTLLFGGALGGGNNAGDTWEYYTRGGACSADNECNTGHCVDGVCCETLCDGVCMACDQADPGNCTPVTSAADADSCAGSCDTSGTCIVNTGEPCTPGSTTCASGQCVDGYCCDSACAGACDACNAADLGWPAAANGTCQVGEADYLGSPACAPYVCNGTSPSCTDPCVTDADCLAGYFCDAAGACSAQKAQGEACNDSAGSDCLAAGCRVCATGNCVDGFCCQSACAGACDVCDATPGTCTPAAAGSAGAPRCEPFLCDGVSSACASDCSDDSECAASGWCNPASSLCEQDQPDGQSCTDGAQCDSSFCVGGVCCNSDCAGRCDDGTCVASSTCVDEITSRDPDGNTTDCKPFVCASGTCLTECAQSTDCISGYVCDPTNRACVAAASDGAGGSGDEGGCSCGTPGSRRFPAFGAWALLLLAGLLPRRMRRRAG